jgi:hypothetical protein
MIRISGLCEALKEDEGFLDLLEELKLENQNLAYVSPYVRIAYVMLSVGARVHGMNSIMAKRKMKLATKEVTEQPIKVISTKEKVPESKAERDENGEKIIDLSD